MIEQEARIAGYSYRARGGGENDAAFVAWLCSIRAILPFIEMDADALRKQWDRGVDECKAFAPSAILLSPREVAALKGISCQSVYAVLQDDRRRAIVFPSAKRQGQRHTWRIPLSEAEAYRPVRGRGRKARPKEERKHNEQ